MKEFTAQELDLDEINYMKEQEEYHHLTENDLLNIHLKDLSSHCFEAKCNGHVPDENKAKFEFNGTNYLWTVTTGDLCEATNEHTIFYWDSLVTVR